MNASENSVAFGAPGIEPRWTSSAKGRGGTAYHTSCRLWFTLSHGIINEIYYPRVDQPNTRDFQFLISDGETFCHEEKRDLNHLVEYPERDCLFYRLTNSERSGPLPAHKTRARGPASVSAARSHQGRSTR
jgi:glucoamylase